MNSSTRAVECGYSKEAMDIGWRLREFRGNESQSDFCERLGKVGYATSEPTLYKYECGESRIPSDFLWVLATHFNCDVTYILTGISKEDIGLRTALAELTEKYSAKK